MTAGAELWDQRSEIRVLQACAADGTTVSLLLDAVGARTLAAQLVQQAELIESTEA